MTNDEQCLDLSLDMTSGRASVLDVFYLLSGFASAPIYGEIKRVKAACSKNITHIFDVNQDSNFQWQQSLSVLGHNQNGRCPYLVGEKILTSKSTLQQFRLHLK